MSENNDTEAVVLLSRLRASLLNLKQSNQITTGAFMAAASELDCQLDAAVKALPHLQLADLMAECGRVGLPVHEEIHQIHLLGQSELLLKRREQVLADGGSFLNLDDLFPGLSHIPLSNYDWLQDQAAFSSLLELLTQADPPFEVARQAARSFFRVDQVSCLPADFPLFALNPLNRLLNMRLVERAQVPRLSQGLDLMREALDSTNRVVSSAFFAGEISSLELCARGHAAQKVLKDALYSPGRITSNQLANHLMQWNGPNAIKMLNGWFISSGRLAKSAMLLAARTGINPLKEPQNWFMMLQSVTSQEQATYQRFSETISQNRLLYDLTQILALCDFDDARSLWWPILLDLRQKQLEENEQQLAASLVHEPIPDALDPDSPEMLEDLDPEDLDPEDLDPEDLEDQLQAPQRELSPQDRLVEDKSSWNDYVKPFLREEMMALLGGAFIITSMIFFSWYFWEKGVYGRAIAGLILPLVTTIGTAYFCRFISKREQKTSSPGALFAVLSFLSVPFNFFLGGSLLGDPSAVSATAISLALGVANLAILPLVARWIEKPLGHRCVVYLLLSSGSLYLPYLFGAMFGIAPCLNALLFLNLCPLWYGIHTASERAPERFRFNFNLYLGHYLLAMTLSLVFFRYQPPVEVLGLLACSLALLVARLAASKPLSVPISAGLALLGVSLLLSSPVILPMGLALSCLLWFGHYKRVNAHWPAEVLAVHWLALVVACCLAFKTEPLLLVACLLLAQLVLWWHEARHLVRELNSLSLGQPILVLLCHLGAWLAGSDRVLYCWFLLALLCGAAAYVRQVRWNSTRLWLFTLALMALFFPRLPLMGTVQSLPVLQWALAPLFWILFSSYSKDALAVQHRTSVLWALSLVSTAFWVAALADGAVIEGTMMVAASLNLICLAFAARRARSSLPLFVALALFAALIHAIRLMMGWQGRTGLGMTILAALFLFVIRWLDRKQIGQDIVGAELFFSRPFLMADKNYLRLPLQVSCGLLLLLGLIKAFSFYQTSHPFMIALSLCLNGFVLAMLATKLRSKTMGSLLPLPLLALIGLPLLFLGESSYAPYLALSLWVLAGCNNFLPLVRGSFQAAVADPFERAFRGLVSLAVPAGFILIAYAYLVHTLPGFVITSLALMLFYHTYLVKVRSHGWCNLVWLHLLLLILAGASWFPNLDGQWLCLVASLPLALLAWMAQGASAPIWRAYGVRDGWSWMLGLPLCVLLVLATLSQQAVQLPALAGAFLVLMLWNRLRSSLLVQLLQTILLTLPFAALGPLWSVFGGLLSFGLLSFLGSRAQRWPRLRLAQDPARYDRNVVRLSLLMVLLMLAVHLSMFMSTRFEANALPHYLLYGLIPICFWLHRRMEASWLAYLAVGLFAYVNGFLALLAVPWLKGFQLSALHALSGSFMLSLLLFQGGLVALGARMKRHGALLQVVEHVCVALTVLIICIATLAFVTAPDLGGSKTRFLFSGCLLGLTALYLRFRIWQPTPFQRAIYRVATTMVFWSLGMGLLPFPRLVPWLIALPAFFFLFRLETKKNQVHDGGYDADSVAAGMLFLLSAFIYFQQQPLRLLLFPELSFSFLEYFINAPILIVTGLGLMRLHRHTHWGGLSILGSVLVMMGTVLTGSWLSELAGASLALGWWLIIVPLLVLFMLYRLDGSRQALARFSGLSKQAFPTYRLQLYGLCNLTLVGAGCYLMFKGTGQPWVFPLLIACLLGWLYDFRRMSVSWVLVLAALLVYPLGPYLVVSMPPVLWTVLLAGLMVCMVWLRRQPERAHLLPNLTLGLVALVYLANAIGNQLFSPSGLLRLLVLVGCWVAVPDRPLAIARQHQLRLWPGLMALTLLCAMSGYREEFLPLLALLTILPPALALWLLSTSGMRAFVQRRQWHFVEDWLHSAKSSLLFLSLASLVISGLALALNGTWFEAQWLPVVLILMSLGCSCAVAGFWAVRDAQLKPTLMAELFLWAGLGLFRWKLAVLESLGGAGQLDGYFLLLFACLAAGVREVVKDKTEFFAQYFYRSTQFYGLLGWALMLYLQFSEGLSGSGELASAILSGLYLWLSRGRNKGNLVYAFLFANVGASLLFLELSWHNLQFYVTPILTSVLVLSQLFRQELGITRLKYIRLYSGLIMLATSAWYNVVDFESSVWYSMVAALVASLIVVAGIALRVRIFLYMGSAFLVVNLLASLVHVLVRQPPGPLKLMLAVVSLLAGCIFIASFLIFQAKRAEILERYEHLLANLNQWD